MVQSNRGNGWKAMPTENVLHLFDMGCISPRLLKGNGWKSLNNDVWCYIIVALRFSDWVRFSYTANGIDEVIL